MPAIVGKVARRFEPKALRDLEIAVGDDMVRVANPAETNERDPSGSAFSSTNLLGSAFESGRDRIGAYRDYRTIDANVPEMSRALTIIATNATSGDQLSERGFELEFAEELPEADREICRDLVKRLNLTEVVRQILRSSNKMGDVFELPVYDRDRIILYTKNLDPELTERVHNRFDRLESFTYKGFKIEDQTLAWWEVIHLRHDPERGSKYGRSLFAGGGRTLAHRVLTMRDALTLETLNHSTARHAIFLPHPHNMHELKKRDWLRRMREAFSREVTVDSTGLLSRRTIAMLNQQHVVVPYAVSPDGKGAEPRIQPLQNAPVEKNIRVAEHFQDLLFVLTGVPKSFFGIDRGGDSLGSQRLDRQDLQFARQLNGEQLDGAWVVLEFIRRQFALLGKPLPGGAVTAVFPDLREFDAKLAAEIAKIKAEAAAAAFTAGLPFAYVWNEILYLGDLEEAKEKAELYGVDLDSPPVPAPAGSAPSAEAIALQVRGLREMLSAVRGAVLANEAVTLDEARLIGSR